MSLISWFNHHNDKMSHTYHHLYTLHPSGDREIVLPVKPAIHALFIFQLFTINIIGGGEPWSFSIQRVFGQVKLALTGKFETEWLQAVFTNQVEARKKAIAWARLLLLFNAGLIAVSVIFRLWPLIFLVTSAPFIANWLRYFVSAPMHTGLRDNVADFRLCVRTLTLDPFTSFLYWRINWHTEHHMYAAVPCYNLKKLHRTISTDMPKPRTIIEAWREMRQTWRHQRKDSTYQFDTPLPQSSTDP